MPGLASLQMGAVNTMSQRIRSGNVVLDMAVAGLLSAAIASAIAFFDKWLRPRAVELWQHLLAYFGDAVQLFHDQKQCSSAGKRPSWTARW